MFVHPLLKDVQQTTMKPLVAGMIPYMYAEACAEDYVYEANRYILH
jgi:hypothetical protein